MKPIEKDELFAHLEEFLKAKGIEMKEGSYTKGIQAGCSLLVDAINLTQAGAQRAKSEIDKRLEAVRQAIHEKTAPKPASGRSAPVPPVQTKPSNSTANRSQKAGKKGTIRGAKTSSTKAKRKGGK